MKLCLLLGGPSAEREVSFISGIAMAKAYVANGHDVTLLDPATGRTMRVEEFVADPPHMEHPTAEQLGALTQGTVLLDSLMSEAVRDAQIVVLGLHGVPGEDGLVQSVLELLDKPYTGSKSRASALCIDKDFTKAVLKQAGINVPDGMIARKGLEDSELRELYRSAFARLGLPLVVKPNDQGSTVGLTILKSNDPDEFLRACRLAWEFSSKALIEEFIPGRELTVTVLHNQALPIVEIAPVGGFYDYHHKYTKGMTSYTCPAELTAEIAAAIQADALRVFEVCDARGYARIDYRFRPDGTYSCLEINTLPGMTSTSLVPKSAAAAGISFEDLCAKILESAFL